MLWGTLSHTSTIDCSELIVCYAMIVSQSHLFINDLCSFCSPSVPSIPFVILVFRVPAVNRKKPTEMLRSVCPRGLGIKISQLAQGLMPVLANDHVIQQFNLKQLPRTNQVPRYLDVRL